MEFRVLQDMLFSDTGVPDVFICDIMPTLPSDCVKVYIYGLFLCKYNKQATWTKSPKSLAFQDSLNTSIVCLENENLLVRLKWDNLYR